MALRSSLLPQLQPQVVVLGWSELRVNKGSGPFYSVGGQRMADPARDLVAGQGGAVGRGVGQRAEFAWAAV